MTLLEQHIVLLMDRQAQHTRLLMMLQVPLVQWEPHKTVSEPERPVKLSPANRHRGYQAQWKAVQAPCHHFRVRNWSLYTDLAQRV